MVLLRLTGERPAIEIEIPKELLSKYSLPIPDQFVIVTAPHAPHTTRKPRKDPGCVFLPASRFFSKTENKVRLPEHAPLSGCSGPGPIALLFCLDIGQGFLRLSQPIVHPHLAEHALGFSQVLRCFFALMKGCA